jgi:cephalosporin-C deacetylase-like acetyl esterase
MSRHIPCRSAVFALLLLLLASQVAAAATYNMDVTPDRKEYKVGDEITFRINLRVDGRVPAGQQVAYTITSDDGKQLGSGSVAVTGKPAIVKAKAEAPGFVTCATTLTAGNLTIRDGGMAIVAPEQIKPSATPPDDFAAFWQSQRKLLADKPAAPTSKPAELSPKLPAAIKQAAGALTIVDIEAPTIDGLAPMRGYLARPRNAKPGTLPAILLPPSDVAREFGGRGGPVPAGTMTVVTGADVGRAINAAKTGMLALSFNLHGVENGLDSKAYQALAAGELKDVLTSGHGDREQHLLHAAILRQQRALDVLAADPHWNGKVLVVHGQNIGGGLALAAAALDPRVTLCVARDPATADLVAGATAGHTGWPRAAIASDEKAKQAAAYVDAANFATRIKCPVVMTAMVDERNAPPRSAYAAFAAIPQSTPKQLLTPGGAEASWQAMQAKIDGIIRKHVSGQAAAAAPNETRPAAQGR